MVESNLRRSGGVMLPTLYLVLPIRSRWVIVVLSMIIGLGHRVPNLRLVGLSQLHHILFVEFVGRRTMSFMKREGTSVLNVVIWVTCRGIVLLRMHQGQIRFLL